MAVLKNRAKMSTSTTGTGTITLGSAESGYQTFADAGVANADVVRYVIEDGNNWEIGTGTYTATGTTLSRTVSESSNSDAAINLSGSATVFIGATAEDIPALYAANPSSATDPVATGANAVAIGDTSVASGADSISLGSDTEAKASFSVALGQGATAETNCIGGVAIGYNTTAWSNRSISIGNAYGGTGSLSNYSTAIGYRSKAGVDQTTGQYATALGIEAIAIGQQSVALTDSYASGNTSLAAAIANNTSSYGATGASSIAIGRTAKATGQDGIAIGDTTTASATNAVAIGNFAVASATKATVIGGDGNTASGGKSVAIGGYYAEAREESKIAFGGGYIGANPATNSYQAGLLCMGAATTDATATALRSSNAAAGTTNQVILPNNSAYSFSGTIIARESAAAGSDYASWEIKGALLRDANAASTVLGNGIQNKLYATSGASAWAIALSADTTNGGLKIEVTGAAATNIRWVATVNTSEVTYA